MHDHHSHDHARDRPTHSVRPAVAARCSRFCTCFLHHCSAFSTLGTLCIVLGITMIKEGVEDYKR